MVRREEKKNIGKKRKDGCIDSNGVEYRNYLGKLTASTKETNNHKPSTDQLQSRSNSATQLHP